VTTKPSNLPERPVRVGLISLGCAKNLVDAEIMLGSLLKSGIEIVNDATSADVVIVNTCSFIDSAQEESVDAILESSELREKTNPGQGIIVSGCLPQRFRDELPKLLPEVDAFMGIDQVAQVSEIVEQALIHRRERLAKGSPRSKVQSPQAKEKIAQKFSEIDKSRGETVHEHEEKLRGTDKFGKTKIIVAPAGTQPASPDTSSSPLTSRISPRRAFASPLNILLT
jgi:tRNA A37 methylthiotransferase MiaB